MDGLTPSASLLRRIERGEVGGVILFGRNIARREQIRAATRRLHEAARRGGQPRLLVLTDQEGGEVRRFASAPPALSAAELGTRSLPFVRASGEATGRALRGVGVNVDLAPVADVPRVQGSFLVAQGRAFSSSPAIVASRTKAFAAGLATAGVFATAKHFPGLGGAVDNTDLTRVTITGSPPELRADLVPFRGLVDAGIPLVMISNARYPAYGSWPAAWSPAIDRLLRDELGFKGVTISDALAPLARSWNVTVEIAAIRAAKAGVDLLLVSGAQRDGAGAFDALLSEARRGALSLANLEESYRRIAGLRPA
jgi:beta-N-acetylhexosaminidase